MNKLVVLMPVYKNKRGLLKTLESLRNEFGIISFDVLLIDDSPETELHEIDFSIFPFKSYLLVNGSNLGITKSLNRGLSWIIERSNYTLIARLDAGDEVINKRLLSQVAYMDANPECVLLGGKIEYITENGKSLYIFSPPVGDLELRAKMHLNNYVSDATAMIRISAIKKIGGWSNSYPIAEGYDLAWRLAKIGKIANLSEIILRYEVSTRQVSLRKRRSQLKSRILIQLNNFDIYCFSSYWGIMKSIIALILPWHFIIYAKSLVNDAFTYKGKNK